MNNRIKMNSKNFDLLQILNIKKGMIDYSLYKMKEAYNNICPPKLKKGERKVVKSKDIGESAWFMSFYGEYFFLEVTSFFDTLARNLTQNQNHIKEIPFQNWIEYQYKHNNNDNFIIYLKGQLDNWYEEFKKIRNKIAHQSHLYFEIEKLLHFEVSKNPKIEFYTMTIGQSRNIELFDYCKDVQTKLDKMIVFIEKNNYWNKQYKYK